MSSDQRTKAIRAGLNTDRSWNAVIPPLSLSTAYRREDPAIQPAFDYARTGNPGRSLLADAIAELENAAGAIVTGSGMSAIDLLLHDIPHGARVICSHDAYGGTRRLLDARGRGGRLIPVYVDTTDLEKVADALNEDAALIIAETPSNPRLRISDIKGLARLARNAGTELAVDNTVMSPVLQRPLDWGADYSVQSVTKLLNGHSDMVGGVVCCADPERVAELGWWANCVGVGAAAFDSYLALRGLRTLPLRARAQCESAQEVARWLDADPRVARVDYPGLTSHPGHALAARQQDGFGQLISLELAKDAPDPRAVVSALEIFTLAQSLGGVESLCCIPALMTHASMSPEARAEAGVADSLIRLSIGLESAADQIADLDRALSVA
ncbi:MAG: cystathionine gamma-synthase [Maricaulis maris]|jgi:cystathionine gamma-synthase|uniref:Cystathionine gamma-synthase n=1 Tax=Maricaulis maris (strain MCS10) TaxID=394221 RepID=Q0ALD7_MARMM|nr:MULTISPECIES: PLP-dependent transferase [Maricaulis]ABI66906.1 cystathionine gamma-synthase [Maricaulis maris MCS10]MAC90098.1 cystathionine gamma-synthase [Maricaulis sp.]